MAILAGTGIARSVGGVVFATTLLSVPVAGQAFDFGRLWRAPEQQAQRLEQAGEYDALAAQAREMNDGSRWQGVADYRRGDYEQAAAAFATDDSVTGAYNHGTALARAGELEQALEVLDEVLQRAPDHLQAKENRDIVEQALQQQQQQQQEQQQQSGEDGEDQQQDQSEQNQGEQGENQDQQQSSTGEQGQQQGEADDQQAESEAGQQPDEQPGEEDEPQLNEEQRSAEQQAQLEQQQQQAQQELQAMQEAEEPLSESEQATQQWLRQIPDDPAGLLRRKLHRSHRLRYPTVGDDRNAW